MAGWGEESEVRRNEELCSHRMQEGPAAWGGEEPAVLVREVWCGLRSQRLQQAPAVVECGSCVLQLSMSRV